MKPLRPRLVWSLIALCLVAAGGFLLRTADEGDATRYATRYETRYETLEGEIFATHYRVTYAASASLDFSPQAIQAAIDEELERIDWMASSWKEASELSRYNRAEDKEAFTLSEDLAWLLARSREIQQLTDGAFNIEFEQGTLNLSAIAKGYAVDQIADYLGVALGIDSFLVNIGGDVKAQGVNPEGALWRVGIFIPPGNASNTPPRIDLKDSSISTSGAYFKVNHIIDPAAGDPIINALFSVSVITPSNTTADALATALYVMGLDQGMDWARRHQIEAIFVLNDGSILHSGIAVRCDE